jgi:hypothetical protein
VVPLLPSAQIGHSSFFMPTRSRIAPSVTRPARPRICILAQMMSPKTPADRTPIASTTTTAPDGIFSITARGDVGPLTAAAAGISSRAGTKRMVKAGPAIRF